MRPLPQGEASLRPTRRARPLPQDEASLRPTTGGARPLPQGEAFLRPTTGGTRPLPQGEAPFRPTRGMRPLPQGTLRLHPPRHEDPWGDRVRWESTPTHPLWGTLPLQAQPGTPSEYQRKGNNQDDSNSETLERSGFPGVGGRAQGGKE